MSERRNAETSRRRNTPVSTFRRFGVWLTALLMAATVALYWPVRDHEFINYDDDRYVTDNAIVQRGITMRGIVWAFSSLEVANWHPVTWLSHMLDCEIFGGSKDRAGDHHLVNVVLHAINAALLVWLLASMTGAFWRSWLVAALFALHPLHVESVAWVAERKDVLSTLFGLLTLIAYVRWTRIIDGPAPRGTRAPLAYALMLGLFALGLMAKPMLVTWPFVMLLMDIWPLKRFWIKEARPHELGKSNSGKLKVETSPAFNFQLSAFQLSTLRVSTLLIEKLPLLAMSAASCVMTVIAQARSGAVWSAEALGIGQRVVNAAVAYAHYLWQTIWPTDLAVIYPLPANWPMPLVVASFALLAAVTVAAFALFRRRPWVLIGWLWFLGTLVPVIGIVQVGPQAQADRYTYIPLIGIFIMLAWSLPHLNVETLKRQNVETLRFRRFDVSAFPSLVILGIAAALIALAVRTSVQLQHWRSSLTLFEHALAVTERNSIAHGNYAAALVHTDPPRLQEAIDHNRKSLEYWPNNAKAAENLGNALALRGDLPQSLEYFQLALTIRPHYPEAMNDMGVVYARMGKADEAMRWYRLALETDPNMVEALANLGGLLVARQQYAEAMPLLEQAIELRPSHARAHFHHGVACSNTGQPERAAAEFEEAARLKPDYFEAWMNLGSVLLPAGRFDEAAAQFEQALRIQPDHPMARNSLARALHASGRHAQSLAHLRRLLEQYPDDAMLMINIAEVLLNATEATVRDPVEALELCLHAATLTQRRDAQVLSVLAHAQAANGEFAAAVDAAQEAMALAQASNDAALIDELQRQLAAYRAGRTASEPASTP
jgi:tetratricopeptide (TPR) repeat protein